MKSICSIIASLLLTTSAAAQTAGPTQGPMLSAGINNTRYVVGFNGQGSIQKTVNAALAITTTPTSPVNAEVVIPAGWTLSDPVSGVTGGATNVWIIDERTLPWTCYTWQGSSYSSSGVNCATSSSGTSSWSGLTNPTSNLALTMGAYSTIFTFGSATGASDLFEWTDSSSNTGTGILGHFKTQSGSTEIPWQADSNGVGWQVTSAGVLKSVGSASSHSVTLGGGTSASPVSGSAVITTDSSGNAELCNNGGTCAYIATGSGVADTTTTVGVAAVAANSCSTATTVTMTGLTTAMVLMFTPTTDVSAVTGWGSATPGLYITAWPSAANTASYKVCNSTAASITPGASVTFNVGAK